MSDRYCAWLKIGGRIERSKLEPLVKEVGQSSVAIDWGEPLFEPNDANELLNARKHGWVWLCDEQARYGEFPELEETCRKLSLAYQRYCEAWCGYDAEIVEWRPGMKEPLIRTCSNEDSAIVLVDGATVAEVLVAIEAGRAQEAITKLRSLCPDIPNLPHFEIV